MPSSVSNGVPSVLPSGNPINVGGTVYPTFDAPATVSVNGNFAAECSNAHDHMMVTNTYGLNVLALWNKHVQGLSVARFLRYTGEEQGAIGVTCNTPWGDSDGSMFIEFGNVYSPATYGKLRFIQGRLNAPSPLLRQLWDSDGSITTYDQSGATIQSTAGTGVHTVSPSANNGSNAMIVQNRSSAGASTILFKNSSSADGLVIGVGNPAQGGSLQDYSYLLTVNRALIFTTFNGSTIDERMRLTTSGLLTFGGGVTSSFPALKRSAAVLQGRLGDDSGFCAMQGKLTTDANATTGLSAGALAATTNASIVLYDASGQAYRVPCII